MTAFALMAKVEGVGFGPKIVKDMSLGGDREKLAARLGAELAAIHRIRPPQADLPLSDLAFLGVPPKDPALADIAWLRAALDSIGAARPALEWALRWAELTPPKPSAVTLVHRDFRTGNYMVDAHGLTAILDWEFADWGDPMSDLGWFCAECWRFGRRDLEAGGIGTRAAFEQGYRDGGGVPIDREAIAFWEVMAHVRWAVIALQQGARHAPGACADRPHRRRTGACGAEDDRTHTMEGGMTPETTGADLIAAAERTLASEVAPAIAGEARFKVLMAASALRMVMRELAARQALDQAASALGGEDQRALVSAIRAGRHDAEGALHSLLIADAEARTSVSRPEAL
jgi:thiamine kinase-like enzyme